MEVTLSEAWFLDRSGTPLLVNSVKKTAHNNNRGIEAGRPKEYNIPVILSAGETYAPSDQWAQVPPNRRGTALATATLGVMPQVSDLQRHGMS